MKLMMKYIFTALTLVIFVNANATVIRNNTDYALYQTISVCNYKTHYFEYCQDQNIAPRTEDAFNSVDCKGLVLVNYQMDSKFYTKCLGSDVAPYGTEAGSIEIDASGNIVFGGGFMDTQSCVDWCNQQQTPIPPYHPHGIP